jgi:hypothetical protein
MNKLIWDESDFDKMSWHDNFIHAFTYDPDENLFLIDIDYITEWINPKEKGSHFSFVVAPSTLIFDGVYDLDVDIKVGNVSTFDILEINREIHQTKYPTERIFYRYEIVLSHIGKITFASSGYKMYIRNIHPEIDAQSLTRSARGGVSFDTTIVNTK